MEEEFRALEVCILRLLCQSNTVSHLREEVIGRLRTYAFRSVEHQVLFDCLQAMPLDRPELVRELLPARLVRAGFPDIDLAPFFDVAETGGAGKVSDEEAGRMCRELMEGVD